VAAVAVSSTLEPESYSGWSGFFATEPLPTTVTSTAYWSIANVAVMFFAASTGDDQRVVVPLASPLQPAKCQPSAGVAVSSTLEPWSYSGWSGSSHRPVADDVTFDRVLVDRERRGEVQVGDHAR
jgi:hypothetical protein